MLLARVVRLVRQTQPTLIDVQHVLVRICRVAVDVDHERPAHPLPAQPAEHREQALRIGDQIERGQLVGDRRQADPVHRLGVHEAAVQIADQLFRAARLRVLQPPARRPPPRSPGRPPLQRRAAGRTRRPSICRQGSRRWPAIRRARAGTDRPGRGPDRVRLIRSGRCRGQQSRSNNSFVGFLAENATRPSRRTVPKPSRRPSPHPPDLVSPTHTEARAIRADQLHRGNSRFASLTSRKTATLSARTTMIGAGFGRHVTEQASSADPGAAAG